MSDLVFGPIPSRRLGQSLGINNIPPKTCSYSCVYCQVGRTTRSRVARRAFFDPDAIVEAVSERVEAVRTAGGRVDYLTFVPDGEPTLDANLGHEIEALAPLGVPVAVIPTARSCRIRRSAVRSDSPIGSRSRSTQPKNRSGTGSIDRRDGSTSPRSSTGFAPSPANTPARSSPRRCSSRG